MKNVLFLHLFFVCIEASVMTIRLPTVSFEKPQDVTTMRANTLFDDADDIQRQLNNEAKDRMKNQKATSVWVFHYPSGRKWGGAIGYRTRPRLVRKKQIIDKDEYKAAMTYMAQCLEWEYSNQVEWSKFYPGCSGRAQSPVDLPHSLLKVTGARELVFKNHDVKPLSLTMTNDGRTDPLIRPSTETPSIALSISLCVTLSFLMRPIMKAHVSVPYFITGNTHCQTFILSHCVKMTGKWHPNTRPFVQGGAVHGRRYLFNSIHLHWPSEHTIGTMHYPVESQVLYVSVEYQDLAAALRATDDNMALLGISTIYTISNQSDPGINTMMNAALSPIIGGKPMASDNSLAFFSPPFKEYASYQGSLTIPPCTESVIWLIRARSLPVTATLFKAAQRMKVNGEPQRFIFREAQPLNDRNVFFFD